uniref:Secreted protein n=1 Tax=Steinernema glaseri TaxID=37863 RepID=A0A1I8AH06_9BILA
MRTFLAIALLLAFQFNGANCKAEEGHTDSSKEDSSDTTEDGATTVAATTAAATHAPTTVESKGTKSEHGTSKATTPSPYAPHGSGAAAEGHIEQSPDSANSTSTNSGFGFYANVSFGFLAMIVAFKLL